MFAHFQDFVSMYVGPFASQAEVDQHIKFCAARGDAAKYLGNVEHVPEGEDSMTPAEDRAS